MSLNFSRNLEQRVSWDFWKMGIIAICKIIYPDRSCIYLINWKPKGTFMKWVKKKKNRGPSMFSLYHSVCSALEASAFLPTKEK